jgi:hypothetical protein
MAREAGFNVKMFKPPVITAQHSNGSWVSVGDELKAFEALVRADERSSVAAEREACAKVCEEEALLWPPSRDFKLCAAAIRARGQA